MTIRIRLLFSFTFIIAILLFFGIYQNHVYTSLANANVNSAYITAINEDTQIIRSAQVDFLLDNKREYVSEILDALARVHENIDLIDTEAISEQTINQIRNTFDEYETLFNQFSNNNDQYFAVKSKVIQNRTDLFTLIENSEDRKILEQFITDKDLLFDLLIITQGDLDITNDHTRELDHLIAFGDALLTSEDDFNLQLLGYRIKTSVREHKEYDETVLMLLKRNELLTSDLNQMLQTVASQTSHLLKNQQLLTANSMNQLKQTYIILFSALLLIISVFMYLLSKRITTSLTYLIEGTETIASGENFVKLSTRGNDEFTQLATSINAMSQSLKIANFSIKTYSSQLENMVEAKTYELTTAKNELENVNKVLNAEKEKFAKLAMTDVLTGLNNRAFFIEVLEQKISEASRYLKKFSIMLVDIDFFKLVNDRYGHQVGDDVLRILSDILLSESRSSDIVARYGGEEFTLIFTETNLEQAMIIAERIRMSVESKQFIQKNLKLTISAGLAEYKGENADELLKIVDNLLYQAKDHGRNRIETQLKA